MVPTAAFPIVVFGLANCGWFSTLKASMRTSVLSGPSRVFLIRLASRFTDPGPRMMPRPELPYVAVVSVVGTKHDVSNQWSIVGFASVPLQIRFGRLPVPVDATPCVCVTVSGRPPRHRKIPLSCQPPYHSPRHHGSSYTQLDDNVCLMS